LFNKTFFNEQLEIKIVDFQFCIENVSFLSNRKRKKENFQFISGKKHHNKNINERISKSSTLFCIILADRKRRQRDETEENRIIDFDFE
jgi:hypothetical protein